MTNSTDAILEDMLALRETGKNVQYQLAKTLAELRSNGQKFLDHARDHHLAMHSVIHSCNSSGDSQPIDRLLTEKTG